MKARILMIGAAALAIAPSFASAQTAPPGQGYIHGTNYWHSTGPDPTQVGQPDQSCQDINGGNTGPSYPGNTTTAPGSAFNETNGHAGTMYAGSQPQSMRNSVSVSQYDVACLNQPM
jgi:hypothetical protein